MHPVEKALIELTRNSYEPDICCFGLAKAAAIQPDHTLLPGSRFSGRGAVEKREEERPGSEIRGLRSPRRIRVLDHRPHPPNRRTVCN